MRERKRERRRKERQRESLSPQSLSLTPNSSLHVLNPNPSLTSQHFLSPQYLSQSLAHKSLSQSLFFSNPHSPNPSPSQSLSSPCLPLSLTPIPLSHYLSMLHSGKCELLLGFNVSLPTLTVCHSSQWVFNNITDPGDIAVGHNNTQTRGGDKV